MTSFIRFNGLLIPEELYKAARDNTLVVFAGAGVSRGAPSNLDSFETLVTKLAEGTGKPVTEPWDRFLGDLHARRVPVHQQALDLLHKPETQPNALHHSLLGLFGKSAARVRLVTTNYDLLFEAAARQHFPDPLRVYSAPALPRGWDFTGLVHVHGMAPDAKEIVLTDVDFGRAYLTEGWARRFLVDVFRTSPVLFVGYSYTDVVLKYLARALVPGQGVGRWALVEEDPKWDTALGIERIAFPSNGFAVMYGAVEALATRLAREPLDWKARLAEIAEAGPPDDQESIDEVKQALAESYTTKMLLDAIVDKPRWARWLHEQKALAPLFGQAPFDERQRWLAVWLASFIDTHADSLMTLCIKERFELHTSLATMVAWKLAQATDIANADFVRWVHALLGAAAPGIPEGEASALVRACIRRQEFPSALALFCYIAKPRLTVAYSMELDEHENLVPQAQAAAEIEQYWALDELWKKLLPHIATVAHDVLAEVPRLLRETHRHLRRWGNENERDRWSSQRSAIEPHEQDRYGHNGDVLVDAIRDALAHLSTGDSATVSGWADTFLSDDTPLLRRLGVHALAHLDALPAGDRLRWLVVRVGLYDYTCYHEVRQGVLHLLPQLDEPSVDALIREIRAHQREGWGGRTTEQLTRHAHYQWLGWLGREVPQQTAVVAAAQALLGEDPTLALYPHPDLLSWTGEAHWVDEASPVESEQLVTQAPADVVERWHDFAGDDFDGPSRDGLLRAIRKAAASSPEWAMGIAGVLMAREWWALDFWEPLFLAWRNRELHGDEALAVLGLLEHHPLQQAQASWVASLLEHLVAPEEPQPEAAFLGRVTTLLAAMTEAVEEDEQDASDDWLQLATGRASGDLAACAVLVVARWKSLRVEGDAFPPPAIMDVLGRMMVKPGSAGAMMRCVLSSKLNYLHWVATDWTVAQLVPQLRSTDTRDFQAAWHGLLDSGRVSPQLGHLLVPMFIEATSRLAELGGRQDRFIERAASVVFFHATSSDDELLAAVTQRADEAMRRRFLGQIGMFMRGMDQETTRERWTAWMKGYWERRLAARPAPLSQSEAEGILGWLPHLHADYPEGVALATQRVDVPARAPGSFLSEIREEQGLAQRFPEATVDLLAYLCNGGFQDKYGLQETARALPPLAGPLLLRLNNALARAALLPVRGRGEANAA